MELRRLGVLLGRLEKDASDYRRGFGFNSKDNLEKVTAEIALQRARLHLLLEMGAGEEASI